MKIGGGYNNNESKVDGKNFRSSVFKIMFDLSSVLIQLTLLGECMCFAILAFISVIYITALNKDLQH